MKRTKLATKRKISLISTTRPPKQHRRPNLRGNPVIARRYFLLRKPRVTDQMPFRQGATAQSPGSKILVRNLDHGPAIAMPHPDQEAFVSANHHLLPPHLPGIRYRQSISDIMGQETISTLLDRCIQVLAAVSPGIEMSRLRA